MYEDNVSIPEFLEALGWNSTKVSLFLNPSEVPKPFRTAEFSDAHSSIIWHLNFLVKALTPDVETMAKHLREKDIEALELVSSALDRYLFTLNAVRKRPSKLSTETVQQIYALSLSGSASRIAKEFGVSRKTVYLIKSGAIHSQILP